MKKPVVDTPRDGRAWCDVVNTEPMPKQRVRHVLALGTCNADGGNYQAYDVPIVREVADSEPTGIYIELGRA